jgi:hypothetical protein
MGHPAEARRYLDSLLTFVQPNGLFQVNYGFPGPTFSPRWTPPGSSAAV